VRAIDNGGERFCQERQLGTSLEGLTRAAEARVCRRLHRHRNLLGEPTHEANHRTKPGLRSWQSEATTGQQFSLKEIERARSSATT
jgi:adenylosuccinate synthase